jgi:UDP:flavonoid glycosyltransferase YjiC (YdhE family)
MFPRLFGAVSAPSMLDDLTPLLDRWQPDVVVHDAADFAAPILAAMAGVPNVTHGFGSVTPIQRVTAAAAETDPLWRAHGLEPRPFGGLYDHLYLDIYPPSMQTDDFPYIERIQLLNPVSLTADARDERRSAMTTVSGDAPRVVYLTFGTVFNVNPTFAAAVEALTRFEEAEVFVTVGPTGDVDAFGPQPEHVHIQRYVPQAELLPRCSAVVSHAGSGTLLGSLALGIPQVCLPQAADQFRNAEACVGAGTGIALMGADATADAIEAALRRVLTDEGMGSNAQRIAAEIEAMPSAEQVAVVIEEL